jgi:glutathione-S-conjugate glycine hydrolase
MAGEDVVYLDTDRGAALFDGATVKEHFWTICRYFISEKFLTYCGIASSVTVLNSLGVAAPEDPQIYPYTMFTQENLFTDDVLHHRRPVEVEKHGNTLEQLATILSAFPVQVDTHFAADMNEKTVRDLLVETLGSPDQRAIIDFNRKVLGQKGAGHFSPLAAYHEGEDRFLIMDVARYKLPPSWVTGELLYEALAGIDSDSQKSRGVLVVTKDTADGAD